MAFWLLLLSLNLIPFSVSLYNDPSPGFFRSAKEARSMECRFLTEETAKEAVPEKFDDSNARGDFIETNALLCDAFIMSPGERAKGREAVLWDLSKQVEEISSSVARNPESSNKTWVVDVYNPDAELSAKIRSAVRVSLAEHSLRVSDRVPILPATDIQQLHGSTADAIMPFACGRFEQISALKGGDALLGIVMRDKSETVLHGNGAERNAGDRRLCRNGRSRCSACDHGLAH